jgi:hypothetical protein
MAPELISSVDGTVSAGPELSSSIDGLLAEVGKVTLKSNGDEALSNEPLKKSNGDEALRYIEAMKHLTLHRIASSLYRFIASIAQLCIEWHLNSTPLLTVATEFSSSTDRNDCVIHELSAFNLSVSNDI